MILSQLAPCILLALPVAATEAPREEISLNGAWQFLQVSELETPPTAGDWKPTAVPGTFYGYNYERMWLQRSFTLPQSLRGKRIKLRFDGVKYNSRIYVNGIHVGGCFNGYDAFEVDATEAVHFDQPNQLAVGCYDWTGVFSEGKVNLDEKPAWQRARRFVIDKVIAPIGGHYELYGIWGDVTLVAHPSVYVKDLFIKPSVRRGELVVDYTIANESDKPVEVELRGIVEDQAKDVLALPAAKLQIPAGGTTTQTVHQTWSDAHYWSHEDPYLYHLRSELSTGDVERTRFGFREFWIEGHRYILNGSKINLFASSWWPPREPMGREEIEQQWRALKDAGVVCFRTHTQPWRRVHYDVADEVGLLMIIEGAMWHDPYCTAYHDPTYWDNYAKMIHAMIEREKNRPSVIMWSMENEAYSGEEKTKLAVENLARVGKKAKQWDPTRPIYFESDGDPGGVADAIGMHYVHEYPDYTCWPNEAYWLDKPINPHTWFGMEAEPFLWKKEKPLYLGEFLWVPSGTPANHTVFFGDDAYLDLHHYTRMGKAEAWKMQVLAFRSQEAGGICPWTVGTELEESNPLYRAHQYAYQSIAAYCHDYDRRFYSEETVTRRVEIFNDVLTDSNLEFTWTLSQGNQAIGDGSAEVSLEAGDKQMLEVVLSMPKVDARTPLAWHLTLKRNGKTVFDDTHDYSVFPKLSLPQPSARLGLYDTHGKTRKLLADSGLQFAQVASLDKIGSDLDVLLIGDGTLKKGASEAPVIGRIDPQRGALLDFISRGGRVLVLRQEEYPEGLFDLSLTSQQSTMTFPLQPSHPALARLAPDDLKFWRGDHMVADHESPRPISGATVPIVVSGSKAGLANAPLLERPLGNGAIVHCQMRLVEKANSEPAARTILGNLLQYLDDYRRKNRRTALLGGDQQYRESLRNLGLRFDEFTAATDLADYSSVICRGNADPSILPPAKLAPFLARGGNLFVHRPSSETLNLLCNELRLDLAAHPFAGTAKRADGDHPLLEAIAREDLYWTVKQPGLSWARQPLSREMIDGVVGPRFEARGCKTFELEDWILDGTYVLAQPQGVMFASAGTATNEIDFPESGKFGIGIRARGTPCKGVYPVAEFSVDGKPFGSVQLQGDQWQTCGTVGHVEKGRHTVTVAFVNDASAPPNEDRNLEVDKLFVGRDRRADSITFLTAPSASVVVPRGEGQIVFDFVRWDTEEQNGRKAARYACSLLTALDADFLPRPAVTIECDQMTPQPDMKHHDSRGGVAYMGCNGYIKTAVQVAETQRYTMELIAAGDACDGICPLVEVYMGDNKLGKIQLTTEGWRSYALGVDLTAGEHEFSLKFVNDQSSPTGDRNLRLDKAMFYND
jgi:beta-galactosidase